VKLKNTKNTNGTPQIVKQPNWNKCDEEKYQESVQQSLEKLDTSKVKDSTGKISEISDILHLAGNAAIPDYGKVITIKPVGKGIWNREIAEASKASKLAFYEWKQDKSNNTKHSDMKSAHKALCGAQRRANAPLRVSNQEKIMAASIKDSKLFYKLVRNQRQNSYTATDTLIFNGTEVKEHDQLLQGWKEYFQRLFKCDNTM
jgi:uncharacterized protein (UPF0248 family)